MGNRYIMANWKQNLNAAEICVWFQKFAKLLDGHKVPAYLNILIAPTFVHLALVNDLAKDFENLFCTAQNVSLFDNGAHTGQVGAQQLTDYCSKGIVGHSETGDSAEQSLQKISLLLNHGIQPFLCFTSFSFVDNHKDVTQIPLIWEDPANISVKGEYRSRSSQEIKQHCVEFKDHHPKATLLYGGSVNRQNTGDLGNIAELDGVIVGNASLDPEHFFEIVKSFEL